MLRDEPIYRINPYAADLISMLKEMDCYIAGGYARWACSERHDSPRPNDIDVIALTEESFSSAAEHLKVCGARQTKSTEFSLTFEGLDCDLPIQLLKNYKCGTLDAALDKIDFSVCRVVLIDRHTGRADARFRQHEREGRLSILHIDTSVINNTVCRMLRYARKGYDISQEDVLKVLHKVKDCDLDDPGLVPDESLTYRDVAS